MATDFDRPLARLAVVTDLHAYGTRDKGKDSVLDFTSTTPGIDNPLTDLVAEVERRNVHVDALICAGDICNMADYSGLTAAWNHLHKLQAALGAKDLIATCGNHDLDSRYASKDPDPDPKGGLLSLTPTFPFDDPQLTNKFWARNFAVVTMSSGVVVVTLNTSAYHGGQQEEIDFGRVSSRTIKALSSELNLTRDAPGHILVCHHHPLPLTGWAVGSPDTEFMKNGQPLLDALVSSTGKSWLVIHGHRHVPRLIHGASSASALPFILGAGSLGARIPGVPNQFHLVNIYASGSADHASLVGTVETWGWTDSGRWDLSAQGSGLPPLCGFGYRGQIGSLAEEIATHVNGSFASWSSIAAKIPSVNLLMPEDLKQLESALLTRGLQVLRDGSMRLAQVGR
jgi:hypothetical protein